MNDIDTSDILYHYLQYPMVIHSYIHGFQMIFIETSGMNPPTNTSRATQPMVRLWAQSRHINFIQFWTSSNLK